jgi:polyhydroxyalkanoate synthase
MTQAPQTHSEPIERAMRPGPRPLALHLTIALGTWLSSLAALPNARAGSMPWHPGLTAKATDLTRDLATTELEPLFEALGAEINERLAQMLAGIEAYWRHPYHRALAEPPVLWRQGATRLLDYGATAPEAKDAPPVLVVPSLVNRGYVLDISERRSLLRYLAGRGLRPVLVEWGAPGPEERAFDLTDYVAGRLGAALDGVAAACGPPVALAGYCMGGNLALALAQLRQPDLAALVLLATPWDFHAERATQARLFGVAAGAVESTLQAFGELPVDILQAFFAALDPNLAGRKFRAFARMAPESDEAAAFVALEDWLNDGVALTAPVARECLLGWYGENTPAKGAWRVDGQVIDPARIGLPILVAIPGTDRIVPPASARALADAIPQAHVLLPPSGHIGMVVGSRAEEGLWRPLADWLVARLE